MAKQSAGRERLAKLWIAVGPMVIVAAVSLVIALLERDPPPPGPVDSWRPSVPRNLVGSGPRSSLPTTPPLGANSADAARTSSAADSQKSYRLPVLMVSLDGANGSMEHVDFTFTRRKNPPAPLAISIAEDTPGGAGESLRASIWMAAMTAALDRRDNLAGARISIQLPGLVDGGSAGGVVCVAIMSALEGKDLPTDFAMTGAIMPDGTIGSVGGIAQKMHAAAAGGAKRILVPAYLRFEKDQTSGDEIDLKRLAATLNLQFVSVENVAQAYEAVHRLQPRTPQPVAKDVLDLPEKTEELLKQRYKEHAAAGRKLWEAIPQEERNQIAADRISKQMLVVTRMNAEQAYRSGRLLYASETMLLWRSLLEARAANAALFAGIAWQDLKADLGQLDAKLGELVGSTPDAASLISASRGKVGDTGVQLCAAYHDVYGLLGLAGFLQDGVDNALLEMNKPENNAAERQAEIRVGVITMKAFQLLFARCAKEAQSTAVENAARLAATLPERKMTGDVAGVERLFFSAYLASHNGFDRDVVRTAAALLRTDREQALAAIARHDLSLVMYLPVAEAVQDLHRALATGEARLDARFAGAVAAHAHAGALASVSGLIVRWGELDVEVDENGELRYGRTDLLSYLLSAARENALASIAECRSRSIPCVQPIMAFESAELGRDDQDEDKVTTLTAYWNASLQAKVLLMLFDG